MSEARIFKCQQCGAEIELDTVFNFEVCRQCGGNLFVKKDEMPEEEKERIRLVNQARKHLDDCIASLDAAKPQERSERARLYAIVITEAEKTLSLLNQWLMPI